MTRKNGIKPWILTCVLGVALAVTACATDFSDEFVRADKDRDMVLNRSEYDASFARYYGWRGWRDMDADGSGFIDRMEYSRYPNQLKAP